MAQHTKKRNTQHTILLAISFIALLFGSRVFAADPDTKTISNVYRTGEYITTKTKQPPPTAQRSFPSWSTIRQFCTTHKWALLASVGVVVITTLAVYKRTPQCISGIWGAKDRKRSKGIHAGLEDVGSSSSDSDSAASHTE